MLIQTLRRNFTVLRMLKSTRDLDIAVCRDLLEKKEQLYLVVTLKNPDLIYRTMPFFAAQRQNPSFQDFRECFSQEGQFYMVFFYYEKPQLAEKLAAENYSLPERLAVGKSLLSRMVLQSMPACLLYEALQERNLLLDDALQVYFNYRLEDIPSHHLLNWAKAQAELARVFRQLLHKEIVTKVSAELLNFIERLEQGAFTDYLSVYQAYDQLYVHLRTLQEQGEIEPKSLLFRIWERIRRLGRFVKPVVVGLILMTALGYLVYTLIYPPNTVAAGGTPVVIEKIGTVNVK
jgi:hypothetical protein